jgi:hypothetical protein
MVRETGKKRSVAARGLRDATFRDHRAFPNSQCVATNPTPVLACMKLESPNSLRWIPRRTREQAVWEEYKRRGSTAE